VGRATTDTLTNKTITGASNNISATLLTSGTVPAARVGASHIDAATEVANDILTHAQMLDADQQDSVGVLIETPADADDFLFWRANEAVTVTSLDCIVEDATSAVVVIVECDSAGDNCGTSRLSESLTCDVDGATDDGTIGEAAIAAGAWFRAQVGTVTGTPGHVAVTVSFTWDD
jgi:D-serine deaminase-like pyridoxal phosphate-dependent protein